MMVKPSVTELLNKTSNRYELVIATSKRARQIVDKRVAEKNAKKLSQERETPSSIREREKIKEEPAVSVAAEEIASGQVKIIRKEDEK